MCHAGAGGKDSAGKVRAVHEDLSSVPRAHVTMLCVVVCAHNPATRKWRQVGGSLGLTRQPAAPAE